MHCIESRRSGLERGGTLNNGIEDYMKSFHPFYLLCFSLLAKPAASFGKLGEQVALFKRRMDETTLFCTSNKKYT